MKQDVKLVHMWVWDLGSHDKGKTPTLFINSVFTPFQNKIIKNQVKHQPADEQIRGLQKLLVASNIISKSLFL